MDLKNTFFMGISINLVVFWYRFNFKDPFSFRELDFSISYTPNEWKNGLIEGDGDREKSSGEGRPGEMVIFIHLVLVRVQLRDSIWDINSSPEPRPRKQRRHGQRPLPPEPPDLRQLRVDVLQPIIRMPDTDADDVRCRWISHDHRERQQHPS